MPSLLQSVMSEVVKPPGMMGANLNYPVPSKLTPLTEIAALVAEWLRHLGLCGHEGYAPNANGSRSTVRRLIPAILPAEKWVLCTARPVRGDAQVAFSFLPAR